MIGIACGYYARWLIGENRIQSNLASLSGETLSHLDDLGRATRHFSSEEINRSWTNYEKSSAVWDDIVALKAAWQAWERAIIFREVERVGWNDYRSVIIHNAGRYLDLRQNRTYGGRSDYAKKEAKLAEDMIHESIPADLLAKSGPFD
jgi:hypothetical protein